MHTRRNSNANGISPLLVNGIRSPGARKTDFDDYMDCFFGDDESLISSGSESEPETERHEKPNLVLPNNSLDRNAMDTSATYAAPFVLQPKEQHVIFAPDLQYNWWSKKSNVPDSMWLAPGLAGVSSVYVHELHVKTFIRATRATLPTVFKGLESSKRRSDEVVRDWVMIQRDLFAASSVFVVLVHHNWDHIRVIGGLVGHFRVVTFDTYRAFLRRNPDPNNFVPELIKFNQEHVK